MAEFSFELVSPEKLVFSGQVTQVDVPGAEGEFGVLAGHAPVVTILKPGVLTVLAPGAAPRRLFVKGGFAEARPDGLTVLAEVVKPLEELDPAWLAEQIGNAEEDLADATEETARRKAADRLENLREFQAALGRGGVAGSAPGH